MYLHCCEEAMYFFLRQLSCDGSVWLLLNGFSFTSTLLLSVSSPLPLRWCHRRTLCGCQILSLLGWHECPSFGCITSRGVIVYSKPTNATDRGRCEVESRHHVWYVFTFKCVTVGSFKGFSFLWLNMFDHYTCKCNPVLKTVLKV